MIIGKPSKNHIYTCNFNHDETAKLNYQHIVTNLTKYKSEPGFKLSHIKVTDFEITTLPVENHENDIELQERNPYIKFKIASTQEKKITVEFLNEIKDLLGTDQSWIPNLQQDEAMLFKLEGDIYIKNTDTSLYNIYNDAHTHLLDFIKKHDAVYLNILLYRMCDLITQKFCWGICQVGISFV